MMNMQLNDYVITSLKMDQQELIFPNWHPTLIGCLLYIYYVLCFIVTFC